MYMRTVYSLVLESLDGLIAQGGCTDLIRLGGIDVCQYRAANGRRCAIGQFISKEDYVAGCEGIDIPNALKRCNIKFEFQMFILEHINLFDKLQNIHDTISKLYKDDETQVKMLKEVRESVVEGGEVQVGEMIEMWARNLERKKKDDV